METPRLYRGGYISPFMHRTGEANSIKNFIGFNFRLRTQKGKKKGNICLHSFVTMEKQLT